MTICLGSPIAMDLAGEILRCPFCFLYADIAPGEVKVHKKIRFSFSVARMFVRGYPGYMIHAYFVLTLDVTI